MQKVKRIIVVDDDHTVCLISGYVIKKTQPDVDYIYFMYPEKALEYIKEEYAKAPVPTIMLLDINMPILSGWEILQQWENFDAAIRKNFSIYMFSSSIYHGDIEKSSSNPFVIDFIEKPLTIEKLEYILSKRMAVTE